MEFLYEDVVDDLIEGLGEVKVYGICVIATKEVSQNDVYMLYLLS